MVYSVPPAGMEEVDASLVSDEDGELELEELEGDLRTTPPLWIRLSSSAILIVSTRA